MAKISSVSVKVIMNSDPFSFPAGGALHHLITTGTGLAQDLAHTAHVSGFKSLEQSEFSTHAQIHACLISF